MNKEQEKAKEQRQLLKKYLGQYYRAKMKRIQLEKRLKNFREEMSGTKGMQYSLTPKSPSVKIGSSIEERVIRTIEIEERILKQQDKVQAAMLAVMDIIGMLPLDSVERMILEYRHIDCLHWRQIPTRISYSKASCHKYYNLGIDKLLGFIKVKDCIQKYVTLDEC